MRILVALKQVPAREAPLRPDASGRWIVEADLPFEINEPDAYALEAALQLKERVGGEVTVLCLGPGRAAQSIREALAKGADRAVHIEEENLASYDAWQSAQLLARAAAHEQPELILTGLQSDDLGYGQTGVLMAELLGWPHSTIIMSIEAVEGGIRVKRELEDGYFQYLTLPLPAVLTIQSGITKLRYATLMGIKRAKTKPIKQLSPETLGGERQGSFLIQRIYAPAKTRQAQIFTGPAQEAAARLVEKLRFEARVL